MMNKVTELMNQPKYIRNVSIIAHVDHGKTSLTESLTHIHMDVGEEKERGITIKSAAVSIRVSRAETCPEEKKLIQREYLINLIDSPGHVDFSSEVTAALRITDGAICVVDCVEGVCVQTETVLRQALGERVKPVLFLNKIDRIWLEKKLSPQETYNAFRRTIESTNVICHSYTDGALGDIALSPHRFNVAFGSGYFGWGFTVYDFAKLYASRFAMSPRKMARKLWGSHFFDAERCQWTEDSDSAPLNGFCQFILRPLEVLHSAIMSESEAVYEPIIAALGLSISRQELDACSRPKEVLRLVLSRWLPAKQCVLDLAADRLPSPLEAQKYRVPNLYTGPMDSECARDMIRCDAAGTLSVYISKMIPVPKDPGRFIAFGRVFSGKIQRGQELTILNGRGAKRKVQGILLMMGAKPQALTECPAGNVCGVLGIDRYLTKSGTLSDSAECFPFKAMTFSVSPVVKVAVKAVDQKNLQKLVEGLKRLSQFDQIVQITRNKQGQHLVAGTGELHLQTCLRTLREELMKNVPISTGAPIVSFCEGIGGHSGSTPMSTAKGIKSSRRSGFLPSTVCGKSTDRLNRIYLTMQPLSEAVTAAIEDDRVTLKGDAKAFARDFVRRFGDEWDGGKETAARIWSTGCPPYGKGNVFVNLTKGVEYLDAVKSSIISGFVQMTCGGVLGDEPLRGVRVNLVAAKIHPDPAHHGAGQIVPATVRAMRAGLLAASPKLLEPLYAVDVEVPAQCHEAMSGVYNAFGRVRGEVLAVDDRSGDGIPVIRVSGVVPIVETLKSAQRVGFTELLREKTKGNAFAAMKFSHWKPVEGDPLEEGSSANALVMAMRRRKGMKMEMPSFYDFHSKT